MEPRFDDFIELIEAARREIKRIQVREMERFGLNGSGSMYLHALARAGAAGLTNAQLSEQLGVYRSVVTRIMLDLEEKHMVVRASKRSPYLLTAQGREIARVVDLRGSELAHQLVEGITESERAGMYTTVRALIGNMKQYSDAQEEKH